MFRRDVAPGQPFTVWVRLSDVKHDAPFDDFASVLATRIKEADEFYSHVQVRGVARSVGPGGKACDLVSAMCPLAATGPVYECWRQADSTPSACRDAVEQAVLRTCHGRRDNRHKCAL